MEAAFADVVNEDIFEKASEELHVTAYVMLSRAKFLHHLWIMQAFGQQLFSRGPPLGPHLLLQEMRGQISAEAAMQEFAAAKERLKQETTRKPDPMKARFRCAACFLRGRSDYNKPPMAFGAYGEPEILTRILRHGAWARCLACCESADGCRAAAGLPPLCEVDVAQMASNHNDVESAHPLQ